MTGALCNKGCGRRAVRRGWCSSHYNQQRERMIAYGRWEVVYVDAEPVRAHVRQLQAAGLGLRRIAELASVNRSQLCTLLNGGRERGTGPSRRVSRNAAERILAVAIPDAPHRFAADRRVIPAVGTARRLQALVAIGHTQSYLCSRIGVTAPNGTHLFAGSRPVTAATARRVAALFDELQLTPGDSARSRHRAASKGWAPPLAWDEDSIDDPAATPNLGADLKGGFLDRYEELVDMGLTQVECVARMGVAPESLVRQLDRYGIAVSAGLRNLEREHRRRIAS